MSNELERLARRGRLPYTYEVRQVASPVAGADFTITPRPGEVWRLVAVKASLHASAVAGNRFPQLVIDNATDISEKYVAGVATIANGTTLYSWIAGFPVVLAAAEAGLVTVPITERIIQTGWTIHPVTAALDAGDQWSAITVTMERYDSPPRTISERLGVSSDEVGAAVMAAGQ